MISVKMELHITILSLTIVLSTTAEFDHEAYEFTACSDTKEEVFIGYDEEELWHADFTLKRGVDTSPDVIDPITFPGFYELAVDGIKGCKRDLPVFLDYFRSIPLEEDAPQTFVYPKDVVQLGVQNTLICHVTGFFPPSLSISWTKNNMNVTEGMSLSQYRPRTDATFNIFSTLMFTPVEGDIYSCTVNHRALQGQQQTKTWDVDAVLPSVGPAVFCGVGLTLGLLGVAVGTFFLIKGYNCN
ncbi:RLA class II histocompatibility antigen, DP alpha-1 chain-like [Pseudorasbora parva]|uniref:RLA class II histocompatibility antigen, DP alpha-1 chain-like n=1 Tax=Pseudorasbora parva TaxID=51549 RepID=UPI00351F2CE4